MKSFKKLLNLLDVRKCCHPIKCPIVLSAAFVLGLVFIGCNGDDDNVYNYNGSYSSSANSVFVHNGDVYVPGWTTWCGNPPFRLGILWKNGRIHLLTGRSTALYSVFISGDDVYAVGQIDDKQPQATLWKNGCVQSFYDDYPSYSLSIFVCGDDTYLAGSSHGQGRGPFPTLWKNGVKESLDVLGDARSVFVSGKDVYLVGYEKIPSDTTDGSGHFPRLWKNGERQFLEGSDSDIGSATSVYVSGGDVYVAGSWFWKNGVKQKTADGGNWPATGTVFVSGQDVYVTDANGSQKPSSAAIWKNGVKQTLSTNHKGAFATSVFVSDGNVYVAGWEDRCATLWKNGIAQKLPSVN